MRNHRLLLAALVIVAALPLGADWKKAYFGATPVGSWARYSDTMPEMKSTTTMRRRADTEEGGASIELHMEFAENKYPPVINRYTLPPSFALERQLIDFMPSIEGGSLVSGEMDPMPLDAATLEAIRKNAARYEATAKFKRTETAGGRKADRYAYTIRYPSAHESMPATTETGDLWLSADVPFGVVRHTSVTKDDTGKVTTTYERVLAASGTKSDD